MKYFNFKNNKKSHYSKAITYCSTGFEINTTESIRNSISILGNVFQVGQADKVTMELNESYISG